MWCFALACALANTSFNFAGALGFCITYNGKSIGEVRAKNEQMFNFRPNGADAFFGLLN